MKKIFRNRKSKVFKTLDDNNLGSLARIVLSCFVIVLTFYSLPLIANFANDNLLNSKEFKNNSKSVLAYTLDKKNKGNQVITKHMMRDLLVDIYSLNEKETDAVRLDASTIKQLFEDTDYKLQ